MMIVNIPIESIEMRYSADLIRWFDIALKQKQYKYITIQPKPLTDKIREGAFLDVIGTVQYKAAQIKAIAEAIDNGSIPRNDRVVFLMHDGWFPVDQLAYMRDMLGCHEWKFVGLFRAGTYDRWDQLAQHGMYVWGEYLENSWFKIYDKIIVASNFHKQMLLETRKVAEHKFVVIPWKEEVPEDLKFKDKNNWIVFPHRDNVEKQMKLWDLSTFNLGLTDWAKCHTFGVCKTKREYYEMLSKSKIAVSFALQETYGHAMIEATLLGCIPLVPDRLSYKELYPACCRYNTEEDFRWKLAEMMHDDAYHHNEITDLKIKFRRNNESFFPRLFGVLEAL